MALMIALMDELEKEVADFILTEGGCFDDDGKFIKSETIPLDDVINNNFCSLDNEDELDNAGAIEIMKQVISLHENGCIKLDMFARTVKATKFLADEIAWENQCMMKRIREEHEKQFNK